VKSFGVPFKERRYWQLQTIRNNPYRLFNSSLNNILNAVTYRVFLVKINGVYQEVPTPIEGIFEARLRRFRNRLLAGMRSTPVLRAEEIPLRYFGRKRTLYEKAVESLKTKPFNLTDAEIRAFIKCEKQDFGKKVPVPRIIQPRSPRFNVIIGRYLLPLEKLLLKRMDKVFGKPTCMKGYNCKDMGRIISGKWKRFRHPVALMGDCARCDQHHSRQALRWEHSVYNKHFCSDELASVLALQLRTKVVGLASDGLVKYVLDGKRASGDINTSLGTNLVVAGMIYSFIEHYGIDAELIINGDDFAIICEECDSHRFKGITKWFLDFGFTLKLSLPVHSLEQLEFCQSHPVYDGEQYVMVRSLHKALYKDMISNFDLTDPIILRKWLGAVGQCGSSINQGIPVFSSWYGAMVRAASGISLDREVLAGTGLYYLSEGLTEFVRKPIVPEGRVSFYEATGITPDLQVILETKMDSMDFLSETMSIDILDWIATCCKTGEEI
jgi:hypothetical protein